MIIFQIICTHGIAIGIGFIFSCWINYRDIRKIVNRESDKWWKENLLSNAKRLEDYINETRRNAAMQSGTTTEKDADKL